MAKANRSTVTMRDKCTLRTQKMSQPQSTIQDQFSVELSVVERGKNRGSGNPRMLCPKRNYSLNHILDFPRAARLILKSGLIISLAYLILWIVRTSNSTYSLGT